MLHLYAVVLFTLLICLTSWGWAVFPVDNRERVTVQQEQVTQNLPEDTRPQEPLTSPEYDLARTTTLIE